MRIGGDVEGLRAVAQSLTSVAGEVSDTGEYLSKRVGQLVTDAGWTGSAAEEFTGAWEQDAAAVVELSDCTTIVGRCLADLANALSFAQRQLDHAVTAAAAAGMPFSSDGQPIDGPYVGPAATAAAQFSIDANAAFQAAKDARDTAIEQMHDIATAMTGESPSLLKVADVALLGAVLRGYYTLPNKLSERARGALDAFNGKYKATRYTRKHSEAGSKAKAQLTDQLSKMRATRQMLRTDAEVAERFADHFKGGRLLSTSIGEVADATAALRDGATLSRLLDGLPVVDVVLGSVATWAQAKEDHEKGWSWTHAIVADGGSNAAAISAGLATDCIPLAGPFIAPVVSYGVGSWTYEASHEGHWTEHIHADGVVLGTAEGGWDTARATWDNDVYGMARKVKHDAEHPVDAAANLWHGVKDLF
jgi:uncharacterized protein YukE